MDLKKLAKELNLSFSTVSKALRNSHEISEMTKRRVVDKARECNYQVNPLASNFRKQKTRTLALVIPEVVNDFFGPVINGIESIAHQKGYHVLVYLTHEDMQKEMATFNFLKNGRVDGIMLSLSEQTDNIGHILDLKERGIPLILFDRISEQLEVPTVTTDNFLGGVEATEHLIKKGCKRIAFLSISKRASVSVARMNGYLETLRKHSLPHNDDMIVCCDGNDRYNKDQIRELLNRKSRPDGIFASVESLAISAYEVSGDLELKIPKQIKIIAFSNSDMAAILNPSLSAIRQPAYEMGKEAALVLINLIEKKNNILRPQKTIIKSNLIVRGSTE